MLLQNSGTVGGVLNNAGQIGDVVWQSINGLVTSVVGRLPHLIAGALVIAIFIVASSLIKKLFWSASSRTKLDERLRILFSRLIVVAVVFLGFFTALTVVIPSFAFGDFIAGLGLTSLAIGFATKDILNHLFSGVFILWQQPFRIGDYIVMKDDEGWVTYIGVRATSLRRSNGEIILIPNGDIYSSPLKIRQAGATFPMSLKFQIGYGSEIAKAKQLARETLLKSDSVAAEPPPKVVVTELDTDGITITSNFRINSHENRPLEAYDEVASSVLEAMARGGVEVFPPSAMLMKSVDKDEEIG